jgi:hypothetical protein
MVLSEKCFTVDEYIEFEEKSETRHEFHEGRLYPVGDKSCIHNEIVLNVALFLRPNFLKQGYKIFQLSLADIYEDLNLPKQLSYFLGEIDKPE